VIEREAREFKQKKNQRLNALGVSVEDAPEPEAQPGLKSVLESVPMSTPATTTHAHGPAADTRDTKAYATETKAEVDPEQTVGKTDIAVPSSNSSPSLSQTETTNRAPSQANTGVGQHQNQEKDRDLVDENVDDVMVEEDEDMVIY
jgi:hypothetical protein